MQKKKRVKKTKTRVSVGRTKRDPYIISIGHWPFFVLMVMPLFFVMIYASSPWFSLSDGTENVIVVSMMFIFFSSLIFLAFALGKYMYDSLKPHPKEIARDERRLEMTLLFIFCITMFPSIFIVLM